MISFKEFLSSHEERLRAEQAAQTQVMKSWVQSVIRLRKQIEEWIKESDPNQLVELSHIIGKTDNQPTDIYADVRLDIRLGNHKVCIRPVAVEVLGPRWKPGEGEWAGQVDMSGEPYKYELYRFLHADSREEWYLRSTRDFQMRALDHTSFDAALVDLFS